MLFPMRWVYIRQHERGLLFERGVFSRLLMPGNHLVTDPRG